MQYTYRYVARNPSGARTEGTRQAVSARNILAWLREQGLTPVAVNEMSVGQAPKHQGAGWRRIKSADLAGFCWQLTTMVEGGVPITEAIQAISEDMENLQFQKMLGRILDNIHQGQPLSESISKFPGVFNDLACAIVVAGETGGTLPDSLRRLAQYFDNRDRLKKRVQAAVAYPLFVFSFIVLIVVLMMTVIIPKFQAIFERFEGQLPGFTLAYMKFYNAVRGNFLYILGGAGALLILGYLISKTRVGHLVLCKTVLRLPLFGRLISQSFVSVFCRTMSTLLASGVPVLEALHILSRMAGNDEIRKAVMRTREHIVEGSDIASGAAVSKFFPNMVVKMVEVGERSGSLPEVLDRTADYYERKVEIALNLLMRMLEPAMIIVVGAVVLVTVVAIYLPVFTMSGI